uniref:NADH dehydrogenase subunit 2 n=1 Tax=Smilium sinense TaxID=1380519 RepID=UPI0021CCAE98|nr:NADH dehydrogenase subunit 2 [Smilium sinense]UWM12983.1 NADH dehydrogenase subunit 2 [Smilium sinense]
MYQIYPVKFYSFFLIMGTMVTFSSNSLFGAWMGLEINLMSFIPIIVSTENNKKSSEAALKYFLIQAIASLVIMISFLMYYIYSSNYVSDILQISLMMALATKLGMPPFHFWFPEVMSGLSWINSLIITTWQKLAPLIIMSLMFYSDILIFFSISSALVGAISGLNQTSLRKIIAYSSISHLGWMMGVMYKESDLWFLYFILYSIITFVIIISFWIMKFNYFSQLLNSENMNMKIISSTNLLSLGGLPPLMGFYPKLISFYILMKTPLLMSFLIFSSLITLFFYTRLCFSSFSLCDYKLNWYSLFKELKKYPALFILNMMSVFGIIPLLMIFS